jgi:hypothetical protein
MTRYDHIKQCALELGYELSDEDCADILKDSYAGETVWAATTDWLNAWETCADFMRAKYNAAYAKWGKTPAMEATE